MNEVEPQVPPAAEDIHLPGPTIIPFVMAIAITLIVIGTTISWFFSIIGLIIFLICLYRWIADTRRDVGSLPEEHV